MEDYKKKYEEALERARKINNGEGVIAPSDWTSYEAIFPELKESEEKKIRKSLINFLDDIWHLGKNANFDKYSKADCAEWISWLEKQDPKKHEEELERAYKCADEVQYRKGYEDAKREFEKQGERKANEIHPIFRDGDYIRNKKTSDKVLIEQLDVKSKAYCYTSYDGGAEIHSDLPFSKQDEWELIGQKIVEQKPTDKVESKFKAGDWIVYCNEDVDLITGIEDNGYLINKGGYIPFTCQGDVRLWTIQDAKDGDVLAVDNIIFIYKITLASHIVSYCRLIGEKFDHFEYARTCNEGNAYVHPATKEQCDLLFSKMKEAGYEWSDKDRKLIKME